MHPSLESLLLTSSELRAARKEVRQMAYLKWEQAGSPQDDDPQKYWREAELEWIEYHYVPDRYGNGERAKPE